MRVDISAINRLDKGNTLYYLLLYRKQSIEVSEEHLDKSLQVQVHEKQQRVGDIEHSYGFRRQKLLVLNEEWRK
jgi:hypothetical protein